MFDRRHRRLGPRRLRALLPHLLSVVGGEPSYAGAELVEWNDWDIVPTDRLHVRVQHAQQRWFRFDVQRPSSDHGHGRRVTAHLRGLGLLVANPLDVPVLLYEGEELVGAKQNRILDRTILVDARSKLPVPVNCVERGRWSYRTRSFAAAPRAAYPELRRVRHDGGGQAQVWSKIGA